MKFKKNFVLVLIIALIFLTGCDFTKKNQDVPVPVDKKVETISIGSQTINVVEKKVISATIFPTDATNKSLSWTSSNSSVVTVSESGEITGVSAGSALITVTALDGSNVVATANVTVIETKSVKISFTKKELNLTLGKTSKLTVKVEPADTSLTFTWSSTDTKIATVDTNGKVKGIAKGEANITATASNGATATIKVVVKEASNKLTLSCVKTIAINESATLEVKNAGDQKLTWKTSDKTIATITQKGVVKGKKEGKAKITVTTAKKESASCEIEVTKKKTKTTKVTKVDIVNAGNTVTGKTINLNKNEAITLSAKITPTNATNKSVKWESSDTKVLTVSDGKVTVKGTGTAKITVTALDGSKKSAKVTIKVSNQNTTKVKSIEVSSKYKTINVGNLLQLTAKITPSSSSEKVNWTSSNEKIATVDNNGVVKAKAKGKVTITAVSVSNKSVKGEISLTVNANPKTKIKITSVVRNDVLQKIGTDYRESYTFPVGYMNAAGDGYGGNKWVLEVISSDKSDINAIKEVTWTGSNTKVAKIGIRSTADKKHLQGQVAAIGPGTVIVTANIKFTNGTSANYTTKVTIVSSPTSDIKDGKIPTSVSGSSPSYKGTNLVYYTENISGARLTHIYMKNPQKQIKKLDAATAVYYNKSGACSKKICTEETMVKNKLSGQVLKVGEMIEGYIKAGLISKDEQLIAFNGSGWVQDCGFGPTPGVKCSGNKIVSKNEQLYLEFNKRPVTWIDMVDGVVRSSRITDVDHSHWLYNNTIGITKSGILKRYPGSLNVKDREKILSEIKADGVLNTWNDIGLLINDGVILPKDTYYKDSALRQAICQVDKNHFIMYSSSASKNLYDVATTLKNKGCKTAINIDGGGSVQIYTKSKGSTNVNVSTSAQYRSVVNGIYFTDKIN